MARSKLKPGMPIGKDLSVMGVVDEGGVDAVYLVWSHSAWCPMACKLYASAAKARREGQLLRALDHPGIVRCLGTGAPAHVLMEYLDGPTLKNLIEDASPGKAPMSISNALRVAIYIGSALVHLHGRGYVHLDVKPHNVIIHRDRPVLFDLGIARALARAPLRHAVGTDAYMAPEQCQRGHVGPATDVFGLGVLLHQVLSGRLPFPRGRGRDDFPQTRVAATPLRKHLPRAPQELEALLQACLQHDSAQRPAMSALLPALHSFVTSGPTMWPAGFDPSQRPTNRRH